MAWSDYYDMLNAIEKYYGSTSDVYGEVLKYGTRAEDFVNIAKQVPGLEVVTNAKGQVVSYSVTKDITQDLSQGWEIANASNSNIQTGTSKNVFQIQKVSGTQVVEEAGKKVVKETPISKFTNGVRGVLNTPVRGTIAPAIAAVAAGIRLGKAIDSSIYKISDAMGLNPPEELNPETWASLVSEIPDSSLSGAYKWGFNTLFGFDPDTKNGQMYLDENALAYMAQYINTQKFFDGTTTIEPENPEYITTLQADKLSVADTLHYTTYQTRYPEDTRSSFYAVPTSSVQRTYINNAERDRRTADPSYTFQPVAFSTEGTPSWERAEEGSSYKVRSLNSSATFNGIKIFYSICGTTQDLPSFTIENPTPPVTYSSYNSSESTRSRYFWELGYIALFGKKVITSLAPEGVSTIKDSTTPNTSNITTVDDMLALLKETYPELWENRVEQEVAQPDGTTRTITYVPISMPTGGAGLNPDSTGNTQNGTEITEGTATDTQLNTIIQYITRLDSLNKGMQDSDTAVTTPPLNPPATGNGGTPVVPPVTGKASALYSIYNPTLAQVNSLGAWLWSSNFIDQLLKLFSSPMDAIIGLHKVYATPATGASQNIKVGYLDSGVPSKIVTEQYTTIDCGTVNCYEYFGNVLDYNPYTNIRLYLPFIGIIDLSNSDVMRSNINVVYHVDVLTGACLAEVKITRDGGGGTLYQYAGNAATTLPISSGSYMGVISSVSSVATRALAGFASGGALGAVASGATGILNAQGTNVVHSGGFSGNAGAMGCKKPYLIIERPQTETADNTAKLLGYGSNLFVQLKTCKGLTRVKGVHVDAVPATKDEKKLIEDKLMNGVIIS